MYAIHCLEFFIGSPLVYSLYVCSTFESLVGHFEGYMKSQEHSDPTDVCWHYSDIVSFHSVDTPNI